MTKCFKLSLSTKISETNCSGSNGYSFKKFVSPPKTTTVKFFLNLPVLFHIINPKGKKRRGGEREKNLERRREEKKKKEEVSKYRGTWYQVVIIIII